MIRVSKFDKLTEEKLLKLNEIYDKVDFKKGMMSLRHPGYDVKNNHEIDRMDPYYSFCYKIMSEVVSKDFDFFDYTSAFSEKLTPFIFSQYSEGMFYNTHNDSFYMRYNSNMRTDWSCTVFLNDPSEYEGGELMIDIGDREISYKLNAGEYVLYPTGLSHRVNTVFSGKRRVCVFWIESYISDSRVRSILCDFSLIRERYLQKWIDDDPWLSRMFCKTLYELKRQFIDF